jgi:hypothetical protein
MKATRVLWSSVHGICMLSVNNNLFVQLTGNAKDLMHSLIHNFINGWLDEQHENQRLSGQQQLAGQKE